MPGGSWHVQLSPVRVSLDATPFIRHSTCIRCRRWLQIVLSRNGDVGHLTVVISEKSWERCCEKTWRARGTLFWLGFWGLSEWKDENVLILCHQACSLRVASLGEPTKLVQSSVSFQFLVIGQSGMTEDLRTRCYKNRLNQYHKFHSSSDKEVGLCDLNLLPAAVSAFRVLSTAGSLKHKKILSPPSHQ